MKARAGIIVHGRYREQPSDNPGMQNLMLWVVEMPTEQDANALRDCAPIRPASDGSRFNIGLSCGRLFSMIVAGSSMVGVAPIETSEGVQQLAEETRLLLQSNISNDMKN